MGFARIPNEKKKTNYWTQDLISRPTFKARTLKPQHHKFIMAKAGKTQI